MTPQAYKIYIKNMIQSDECNIDFIIDAVLSFVFSFAPLKTTYTELYHGAGTPKLFLNKTPLISVDKVEILSNGVRTEYSGYIIVYDMGFIMNNMSVFQRGYSNIKVTYTAGYLNIPSDLQGAIIGMIQHQIASNKSAGISSEAIDDYRITFDKSVPSNITTVFNKYKKYYV